MAGDGCAPDALNNNQLGFIFQATAGCRSTSARTHFNADGVSNDVRSYMGRNEGRLGTRELDMRYRFILISKHLRGTSVEAKNVFNRKNV